MLALLIGAAAVTTAVAYRLGRGRAAADMQYSRRLSAASERARAAAVCESNQIRARADALALDLGHLCVAYDVEVELRKRADAMVSELQMRIRKIRRQVVWDADERGPEGPPESRA